jgi:uncharacterized protein YjaG (DUF416 family)
MQYMPVHLFINKLNSILYLMCLVYKLKPNMQTFCIGVILLNHMNNRMIIILLHTIRLNNF